MVKRRESTDKFTNELHHDWNPNFGTKLNSKEIDKAKEDETLFKYQDKTSNLLDKFVKSLKVTLAPNSNIGGRNCKTVHFSADRLI